MPPQKPHSAPERPDGDPKVTVQLSVKDVRALLRVADEVRFFAEAEQGHREALAGKVVPLEEVRRRDFPDLETEKPTPEDLEAIAEGRRDLREGRAIPLEEAIRRHPPGPELGKPRKRGS